MSNSIIARRPTRIIALIAAMIAGLFLISACSSSPSAITTVDPQAFLQAASQPGTTVIDVRTPAEYASGHLQGAVNIDVEAPTFAAGIEALNKSGSYAVYCHSGRRSTLASDQMSSAGFTNITNLQGGIADLQAAGGAIVTS
jgi:phage shock protein E